jgi:transposase
VPAAADSPPSIAVSDLLAGPRMSLAEAAATCGVSQQTLRNWCERGARGRVLPTFYVGGRRFVLRADLNRFLESIQEARP